MEKNQNTRFKNQDQGSGLQPAIHDKKECPKTRTYALEPVTWNLYPGICDFLLYLTNSIA